MSAVGDVTANADSQAYWDAARQGRLVFKKCAACGHVQFPPRHLCPACWSDRLDWAEHGGGGSVHSFTIVHRAPTASLAQKAPYVLALIALDDGPRVMANIVGADALAVKLGERVRVVFEQRGDAAVPQFQRAAIRAVP